MKYSHCENHQSAAGKTHVVPENLLYIIMYEVRKIKLNSGLVWQKPQSFHDDWKYIL